MADYKHRREGTVQYVNAGNVVQEGFTTIARRPRGASPGNIVSMDTAADWEKRTNFIEEIYDDAHMSKRRARLMRTARDVYDDEPYLDYDT
jgi:hypothetical protein